MRGFLAFVQFCVLIIHVIGQDVIHPKLKTGTKPENPGMRLRLMPTGLAYLREFGMKVISQEVPRIVLPSITENVDGARVTIKGARIDKYWAPEEYNLDLHPPNRFVWSMNQMHVRSTGQFQYGLRVAPASSPLLNAGGLFGRLGSTILDTAASFPLLQTEAEVSGTFEALLGEMSMAISVALSSTEAGAPFVQIDSCQLAIGYIDMNVRNTGILTDLVINTLKNLLTLRIKPMIEQRMCERIQSIIGKDVNRIMATMPLHVRLDQQQYDIIGSTLDNAGLPSGRPGVSKRLLNKQIPKIDTSALNFIQNLRNQPMSIDYRLITSPFIDTGTITMFCKGEISWLGRGGTPFYPPDITVPLPQGAEMIQFFGTDYIANSMMYHAFQQKFLEMIIGPESSKQLSGMLKTTCDSGFCLGDVLGELGTAYPNREVEVRFSADKAPALFFEEGKATIGVTGFVRIFVRGNKTLGPKIMVRFEDD
uniref:Lipid-binding serum glycoprotein N-terminal domain-containing protein n=1 Tax=Plectus sambesii TaxID=2011161 RepID=A0A914XJ61_9BILA